MKFIVFLLVFLFFLGTSLQSTFAQVDLADNPSIDTTKENIYAGVYFRWITQNNDEGYLKSFRELQWIPPITWIHNNYIDSKRYSFLYTTFPVTIVQYDEMNGKIDDYSFWIIPLYFMHRPQQDAFWFNILFGSVFSCGADFETSFWRVPPGPPTEFSYWSHSLFTLLYRYKKEYSASHLQGNCYWDLAHDYTKEEITQTWDNTFFYALCYLIGYENNRNESFCSWLFPLYDYKISRVETKFNLLVFISQYRATHAPEMKEKSFNIFWRFFNYENSEFETRFDLFFIPLYQREKYPAPPQKKFEFVSLGDFGEIIVRDIQNGTFGVVNMHGEWLQPPCDKQIINYRKGIVLISIDKKHYYWDPMTNDSYCAYSYYDLSYDSRYSPQEIVKCYKQWKTPRNMKITQIFF